MGQPLEFCRQLRANPIVRYLFFKDDTIHIASQLAEFHRRILIDSGKEPGDVRLAGIIETWGKEITVDARGSTSIDEERVIGRGNPRPVIDRVKQLPDSEDFEITEKLGL